MHYIDLHPSLPTWMKALEKRLSAVFDGEYAVIRDAGLAVVTSRGKRLRPLMLLLSCASFGEISERAVNFGATIELIHTASLAHDDVVDEADSRRGAPSAPARWGNKFSILLGDFFFTRVFEIATNDGDPAVLRLLAGTATEMSRAVIIEYTSLMLNATEELYWQVVRGKTAMLYAAATTIGGIAGGASPAQQQAAFQLGLQFGNAFQLADDLLDLQGSEHEVGKPLGVDWRQRRATLPLIYALNNSPANVAEEIRTLWQSDPFTDAHLNALRYLVDTAGGFEYSWQKVKEYREEACGYLESFPTGAGREALRHLCQDAFPLPVMPTVS